MVNRFVRQSWDPQRDPPAFIDEELPTDTLTLNGPERKTRVRAPHGTMLGSYRVTGSYHEASLGTYSLRITRVSVSSGSPESAWAVWHSRTGTKDVIDFPSPGQQMLLGKPEAPIYAFGPGTVFYTWLGVGSAYNMSAVLEGFRG